MAQKVTVELVDDLDGTVSGDISTVGFSLDGVSYEIDLATDNASKLRHAFAGYVGAARRTGGRTKRPTSTQSSVIRPAAAREQTKAIRDWARDNGWAVAQRGRIPANVIEAFETAQAAPLQPKTTRSRKTKQRASSS